jgi:hypothetical protein
MNEIVVYEKVLWGLTIALLAGLVVLLLYRKNHRRFPFFFAYTLFTVLQNLVLFESYRIWSFNSPITKQVTWGTQGVVIIARALAVAEICHRILGKYRGVWILARRLLAVTAGGVLLYSWAVARGSWQFAVLNADRGVELAIASAIVILFLFARYYGVAVESAVHTLAVGFFLYSCFFVVNDTILERWMHDYSTLWNLLGTLAFLASMLLWGWGLRKPQLEAALQPEMLSDGTYGAVAPEINGRLRALNNQLGQLWSVDRKRF